jgi:LysR family glycine cleavage system transcriptional activator
VFGEVGRFKLLFDQVCEAGPAARVASKSAEDAANATSTGGTANANALRVAP